MMMVVMSILSGRNTTGTLYQRSLLAELAARFMPPKIVQPRKAAFTAQAVEFAQHVLVLRPVSGHMALKIGALTV